MNNFSNNEQIDFLTNTLQIQQQEVLEFIFKIKNCLSNMGELPQNLQKIYDSAIKMEQKLEEHCEEIEEMKFNMNEYKRKSLKKKMIQEQNQTIQRKKTYTRGYKMSIDLKEDEELKFLKNFEDIIVDPKGALKSMLKTRVNANPTKTFLENEEMKNRLSKKFTDEVISMHKKKKVEIKEPKIFENFILIGMDINELNDKKEKELDDLQSISVTPKILYDYDSNGKLLEEKEFYSILPYLCFPFGIAIEKIDSVGVNYIMTEKYDKNDNMNDNSYVLTLRTENTFNSGFGDPIINEINPHRLLYAICFQINDVVQKGKNYFWKTPKVYCFLTYYPFVNFIFSFLKEIVTEIKLLKQEKIDFDSLRLHAKNNFENNLLNEFSLKILKSNIECSLINFCEKFTFPIKDISICYNLGLKYSEIIEFKPPNPKLIHYEAYLWCAPLVFSNIPFEDFRFLLYAFMLDNHIAFFSANKTILSLTIILFYFLIKPLLYQGSLISILPENLFEMTEAPTPFLIGLNINNTEFSKIFEDKNPNVLFYDLDNNDIYFDESMISDIRSKYPVFQDIKHEIRNHYQILNNLSSKKFSFINFSNFTDRKKNLIFTPNPEQISAAFKVLEILREKIESNLEGNIPAFQNNNMTIEFVKNSILEKINNKRDKNFMYSFLETQSVSYFLWEIIPKQIPEKND